VQEVMEHYGIAFLGMLEVSGAYAILCKCMEPGGVIRELAVLFLESI